jgi:hypothetical protein
MDALTSNDTRPNGGGPVLDEQTSVAADVDAQLRELLAPLRAKLEAIDTEIGTHLRYVDELRAARRRVAAVLDRAEAQPTKPGPKSKTAPLKQGQTLKQQRDGERKAEIIRAFVAEHADELREEGFSPQSLQLAIREAGVQPTPGPEIVRRVVLAMHDEGEIVKDKIGRGGYPLYKPLPNGG